MNLACPVNLATPPIDGSAADPRPQLDRPAASPEATHPNAPDIETEMHVWSSGSLVAIVRRQEGRTVEVIRVAGDA